MNSESNRKFHILREIASGGFGSVYLAKVIHSDGFSRLAALKLLHPKWSSNNDVASRMRDEARLLGWLRHKNIVDVIDLTRIDGRCAVVMEYLEAVDLKGIITGCMEHGARIPLKVCLEVCAAVASALDAAYNRPPYPGEKALHVIHRDIKPSNVMVDEGGMVKVLDFGVARADFEQREAQTQELSFGSIEYMPPERLFFEPESPGSDVYSLGVTLFEMLALDKFGKAKLRPPDQERFVEDRFDDLLEFHPMPSQEVEDILHDLLFDMLAFSEAERPSAADCVARMRSFARKLTRQEGLEEWCEQVIPSLLRQQQRARDAVASDDPLVDSIVKEDSSGFSTATFGLGGTPVPPPPDRTELADSPTLAPPTKLVVDVSGEPSGASPPPVVSTPQAPSAGDSTMSTVASESGSLPNRVPTVVLPGKTGDHLRPQAPPSEKTKRSMGMLLAGLAVGLALIGAGGVVTVIGAAAGTYYVLQEGQDVTSVPVTSPETADKTPAEAVPPAVAAEDGVRFVSHMPNTRKLTVRCDEGRATGGTEAVVSGDGLGTCTVTAIDDRRDRSSAVVTQVDKREYSCFQNGSKRCD